MRCHIPIDQLTNAARRSGRCRDIAADRAASFLPFEPGGVRAAGRRFRGGLRDERKRSRLDQLRAGQNEIANHVIDEFVGRPAVPPRAVMRRGAVVGMSAPVIGGDPGRLRLEPARPPRARPAAAAAAGKAGATIKVGIITPTGEINPLTVADQGGLDMLGQTGEYLMPVRPAPDAAAGAGHQLDVQLHGRRVDVQDPPGRQVPQRQPADGRRRGLHLQAADQPEERGERAVGVRRGADARTGSRRSTTSRSSSTSRRRTGTSRT